MKLLTLGSELNGFTIGECIHSGGMAHKLPISQLKNGNWDVPKQIDSKIARASQRPRVGMIGMNFCCRVRHALPLCYVRRSRLT
jgi:hypothetical protein